MTAFRSLSAELERRSVRRALGIYVAASRVSLEGASTLTESFGLPERLLNEPAPPSTHLRGLEPDRDPLPDEPRFQALLEAGP